MIKNFTPNKFNLNQFNLREKSLKISCFFTNKWNNYKFPQIVHIINTCENLL